MTETTTPAAGGIPGLEFDAQANRLKFSGEFAAAGLTSLDGNPIAGGARNGNRIMVGGNSIAFYATNFYGTNRNTRSEYYNSAVPLNTVRYPSYMNVDDFVPKLLTATTAGIAGDTEPLWPAVGETVQDGAVVWTVSADTAGYTGIPGYFRICNALLGQALRPVFFVGAKSRRWEYIKQIMDRAIASGESDPDILWLLAPLENDCAAMASVSEVAAVWASFLDFLERRIAEGRRVIVQGIHPASTYSAAGIACAGALDLLTEKWARANAPQAKFWQAPRDLYLSKEAGDNWTPDDVTAYLFSTGGGAAASDGIHPYGVQHVRLGIDSAQEIGEWLDLPRKSFRDYTVTGPQRFLDPRNLTSGGTINPGTSGARLPNDWKTDRTGTATGAITMVARTDGVNGDLIVIDCAGVDGETITCAWKAAKTLATLGLAVGDEIEIPAEIGGWDLSARACIPVMEVILVGAINYPQALSDMSFSGLGNQMQGQALLSRNDLMVYNPLPWRLRIPAGTTGILVSCKITGKGGAWTGKLVIGRLNVEKVS